MPGKGGAAEMARGSKVGGFLVWTDWAVVAEETIILIDRHGSDWMTRFNWGAGFFTTRRAFLNISSRVSSIQFSGNSIVFLLKQCFVYFGMSSGHRNLRWYQQGPRLANDDAVAYHPCQGRRRRRSQGLPSPSRDELDGAADCPQPLGPAVDVWRQ